MKRIFLVLIFHLSCSVLHAQFSVSGMVIDSLGSTPLLGVNLLLMEENDTTFLRGTVTDNSGVFEFRNIKRGQYVLRLSYIGYAEVNKKISLTSTDLELGAMRMSEAATTLGALVVTGETIPVEQKGDTVQYSASSFKVNRDASAEDLIQKMPGITSDESGVKAQGENVRQVLVDGKRFFGDDATAALKNLPAEIIDKIEVFDRMSEQSQFTGFDDGQAQRTINIVTKKGMDNGEFGKINAGIAHTGRYIASGNLNSFKGSRKLTVLGLTNNINQQNFSNEDLLGVTGGSSGNNRGGGRGGSGNNGGNNFLVGQQKGISTTHAGGFNYNNEWGKKAEVSASYFFNRSDNDRRSDLSRKYIARDSGLFYTENNESLSENTSHRFNLRFEYNIDSANSVIITPRVSLQMNNSGSSTGSLSSIEDNLVSQVDKTNGSKNIGYNISGNVLYRHRFRKKGRSISWGVNVDANDRESDSDLYSINEQFEQEQTSTINQRTDNLTTGMTYSSNVAYTEPVGKTGQVQINYTASLSKNDSDKRTYDLEDEETGTPSQLNTRLTNVFRNHYLTNRGGISYRYNMMRKINVMAGLNFQHAQLSSDQEFPRAFEVDRTFQNVLPQASFNYRVPNGKNVRIQYRTSTNAPSVSQLQNVVNNSNPLFLRSGNSGLSQDYQHNVTFRFGNTDAEKGRTFLFFLNATLINDYIGNATFLNTGADSVVVNEIDVAPGQQLSYPVNMPENWNARTFVTYGAPVKMIKSNLNFNTGFNYSRTPAVINGGTNVSHNYTVSQGVVLSSNISKSFDFTLSYTANYTIVENSVDNAQAGGNNYFTHLSTFRVNCEPWKGLVLNSNVTNSLFTGLSSDLDQSIWFWNAAIGYKLLKDKSLEARIQAFDLLNQNKSIGREVTDTFIEDSITNVLTRYFMFSLTYTFRKF
jgi:hypothetical protein